MNQNAQQAMCTSTAQQFQKQCISQGLNGDISPQSLPKNSLMLLFGSNTGDNLASSNPWSTYTNFDPEFYTTSNQLDSALSNFCGSSCDKLRQNLLACNMGSSLILQKQVFCQRSSNMYCYSHYFQKMGPRMWQWEYNLPDPAIGKPDVVCNPCTQGILEVVRQFAGDSSIPSLSPNNAASSAISSQQSVIGSFGQQNPVDKIQARNIYSQLFQKYNQVCPRYQNGLSAQVGRINYVDRLYELSAIWVIIILLF